MKVAIDITVYDPDTGRVIFDEQNKMVESTTRVDPYGKCETLDLRFKWYDDLKNTFIKGE